MKLIGEILCQMVCLKQSHLEQALKEQKEQKEQNGETLPLGQILLDHDYITEIQLQTALKIQEKTNRAYV